MFEQGNVMFLIRRSPTMASSLSPKFSWTMLTASMNVFVSEVFPRNTRIATGRPCGSVNSPYSIWCRGEDIQRDLTPKLDILGQVDHAHASAPELPLDPVAGQLGYDAAHIWQLTIRTRHLAMTPVPAQVPQNRAGFPVSNSAMFLRWRTPDFR